MEFYRQGDVGLMRIDSSKIGYDVEILPLEGGAVVLAHGEVTGHKHQIAQDYATMYRWQGDRLIDVREGAELRHEEHDTIVLPAGTYKVVIQREYSPEAIRNVQD